MAYNGFNPYGYGYPYQQNGYQGLTQPTQPAPFSQPTIHAEIVQINGDIEEAENYPVPTGGTQMMINKAEDKIFIKTVYANNQRNVDVFVKQAPQPTQPQVNLEDFVTKEELERRLSEITTPVTVSRKKKEDTGNE